MNRTHSFFTGLSLCFLLASGCSTTSENKGIVQILEKDVGTVDRDFAERTALTPPPSESKFHDKIEKEIQKRVWWWTHYYSVRERKMFTRTLERGENYRALVQQLLRQKQLPPELFYLACIESSFVNHATSKVSAVGIWQFMRPTAIHYGLTVNDHWDERKNPIAATVAATRYLNQLYREFNSWYLAIAAYNAGEGRIAQAVRKGHTTDFWTLAAKGYLPRETMDYIPKFLAAASIGMHPETFNFKTVKSTENWPEIASVEIKTSKIKGKTIASKLSVLTSETQLSEKELLKFNPQLKLALTYLHGNKIKIWLPKTEANRIAPEGNPGKALASQEKRKNQS